MLGWAGPWEGHDQPSTNSSFASPPPSSQTRTDCSTSPSWLHLHQTTKFWWNEVRVFTCGNHRQLLQPKIPERSSSSAGNCVVTHHQCHGDYSAINTNSPELQLWDKTRASAKPEIFFLTHCFSNKIQRPWGSGCDSEAQAQKLNYVVVIIIIK